jgi:hypothetical protein
MLWPKNLKAPLYVRPNERVRYLGKNYIVKRDMNGAIVRLIGRMTRKLPSMQDAILATQNQKLVCQWGGYYSAYVAIDSEEQPLMVEFLWAEDKKRGIEPPKSLETAAPTDEG